LLDVVAVPPDACSAGKLLAASKALQIEELQNVCDRMISTPSVPAVNKCMSGDLQKHVSTTLCYILYDYKYVYCFRPTQI